MIVDGTCDEFGNWGPLMRQETAAAPKGAAVRESLGVAHASLRAGLAATAAQLDEPGAIRPGLTVPEATDVFWYFLGNGFYFTLADDLPVAPRTPGQLSDRPWCWLMGRP
ncbi:hypothetical protein [Streptomyces vinaceus]|uniref:hypothetical protein n=1 Tax=Streptomyces vinaceus TaxID=1960 RepID=UPI0035D7C660